MCMHTWQNSAFAHIGDMGCVIRQLAWLVFLSMCVSRLSGLPGLSVYRVSLPSLSACLVYLTGLVCLSGLPV